MLEANLRSKLHFLTPLLSSIGLSADEQADRGKIIVSTVVAVEKALKPTDQEMIHWMFSPHSAKMLFAGNNIFEPADPEKTGQYDRGTVKAVVWISKSQRLMHVVNDFKHEIYFTEWGIQVDDDMGVDIEKIGIFAEQVFLNLRLNEEIPVGMTGPRSTAWRALPFVLKEDKNSA